MIFDVYLLNEHIFKYLDNHDYIHKIWLFKTHIDDHDNTRRTLIRKYSAKKLNERLRFNYYIDGLEFSPIISKLDLILYLEDFVEDCLNEKLLTRCDMLRSYPIMNVSSHVLSHTIFYYAGITFSISLIIFFKIILNISGVSRFVEIFLLLG